MESKRKSGKVFSVLGIIFLILAIVITGAGNYFGGILDTYIGLGEAVMVQKPGSENWDTDYYTTDYDTAEEIDKYAKDVTKRIAEEGITLMKNNGTLPLSKGQSVSLFGRRSVDVVWGGNGSGAGDFALENHKDFCEKVLSDIPDKFTDGQNYAFVKLRDGAHMFASWQADLYNSLLVFFK